MTLFFTALLALGCGSDDTKAGNGDHEHHDHSGSTLPEDFDDSTDKTTESDIVVSYSTDPEALTESEEFSVIISHSGGVITEVDATMPSHGGHGMNVSPDLDDDGEGTVIANPFQFHMPGHWELFVQLENDEGASETVRFDMACCD